ncbi:hypothetical protein ACKWTF_012075 [Chironomus riparius]
MSLIFLLILFNVISAEWVKLPNISPTTQVPKVVFKLAQPIKNSFLSSEILNSVISLPSSTTETSILENNLSTRKSYVRQYFQTTVTSHVLNVLGNLSNVTNNEEQLKPVMLQPNENNKNRVIYFNKTVQMNVIPVKTYQILLNKTDEKFENNNSNYYESDDDGMALVDNETEDVYYDDEYYYEDEDQTTKFNPFLKKVTSSTTALPPKTHKKKTLNQKLQRRTVIQMMNSKQYKPFGDVSFPSFIKFLRKIQESFAIRTAKTIGDKIKMLVGFRDQLMVTINKQIRRLWRGNQAKASSKKSSGSRRSKRTLGLDHGHGSGAMDFPSAEGALLSICFLTFAVFLIKLVLQVIQTIKMKKAMWATQMMMGTENVVIKRQRRSTDDDLQKLVNIYDSIEKLRLKY